QRWQASCDRLCFWECESYCRRTVRKAGKVSEGMSAARHATDRLGRRVMIRRKGGGSETLCQSLSVHVSRMLVQTDIASIGTSIAFRRLLVCVKSRPTQLGMCKSNGLAAQLANHSDRLRKVHGLPHQ